MSSQIPEIHFKQFADRVSGLLLDFKNLKKENALIAGGPTAAATTAAAALVSGSAATTATAAAGTLTTETKPLVFTTFTAASAQKSKEGDTHSPSDPVPAPAATPVAAASMFQ